MLIIINMLQVDPRKVGFMTKATAAIDKWEVNGRYQ